MTDSNDNTYQKEIISAPIGVFDSGMGGLTVLRALINKLPHEHFIYLGDTARLPYGTKSKETIINYAEQAVNILLKFNVKMIVIACNTATVSSLEYLQNKYPFIPIIGVVKPGAQASITSTKTNHIGIIATERTILSGSYELSLRELRPECVVTSKPCNIFASLAEEGHIDDDIAKVVINTYLGGVISNNQNIDTLLLGCTHFPVFNKIISEFIPSTIKIVDSAECTADYTKLLLTENKIINNINNPINSDNSNSSIRYLVTDSPDRFKRIGQVFLGQSIDNVDLI